MAAAQVPAVMPMQPNPRMQRTSPNKRGNVEPIMPTTMKPIQPALNIFNLKLTLSEPIPFCFGYKLSRCIINIFHIMSETDSKQVISAFYQKFQSSTKHDLICQ